MAERTEVLIVSDIHYASAPEKQRLDYECGAVANPLIRLMLRFYRHFIWLRNPFGHNHLLEDVLSPPFKPDLVVANGDYSCDTGFIGVADPAARQSAAECLSKLRGRFDPRFLATFGDHELGKVTLAGGRGGLRLASWEAARNDLALEPFWQHETGRYRLIGVTSTLLALPVYEKEGLPEETPAWRELRKEHLARLHSALENVHDGQRVILFCHDPTALPFLYDDPGIRRHLAKIERTVIGHLHSNLIVLQTRLLAGCPVIGFCGTSVRRMTAALQRAKQWQHFKLILCPSVAGIELTRNGGFYRMTLDPEAKRPAEFTRYRIRRRKP